MLALEYTTDGIGDISSDVTILIFILVWNVQPCVYPALS